MKWPGVEVSDGGMVEKPGIEVWCLFCGGWAAVHGSDGVLSRYSLPLPREKALIVPGYRPATITQFPVLNLTEVAPFLGPIARG